MEIWRQCLQSYLSSLAAAGESHTLIQDHTTTLERFFVQHEPASVSREQVEQFCKTESCHGVPSSQTVKRRKAAIRAYFDYAAKQGVFIGSNPARAKVKEVKPLFADEHWQAAYQAFLSEVSTSGSEATVISYRGILERFFREHPNPCDVSRSQVTQFIQSPTSSKHRSGTIPATATRNLRASCLKSFYNFCSAWTIPGPAGPQELFRQSNPTAGYKHSKASRAYKTLSMSELKNFFNCFNVSDPLEARDKVIYHLYLITCRRREELANLRWGDITYGPIADQDGSTRMGYSFRFYGKGHAREADLMELPEKSYQEICAYLDFTGRLATIKPTDPIFVAMPNQHGPSNVKPGELRPLTASTIAKRLKIYCRRAGIDEKKFSMHGWRHTGAFLRAVSGSSLFSVSRTLRHKSLQTTQIYLEALQVSSDQDSKLVFDRLERFGIK